MNQQLYLDLSLSKALELGFSEKEYNDVLKGIASQNIEISRLLSEGYSVCFPEEKNEMHDLMETKAIVDGNLWFGTATLRNTESFSIHFVGTQSITASNDSMYSVTISGGNSSGSCVVTSNGKARLSSSIPSGGYYSYSLALRAIGTGLNEMPARVHFTQF